MPELLHSKIIGKGKPLVILHGLLGMGDNWISLARRYAGAGFQVHLIDQRNHGKSFHSDEMNYEVMTTDLANYLSHYQISEIDLLGHSMGGKTAMFFSLTYPELVNKLIIVDIAPKYYPPHHQFIFKALNKIKLENFSSRNEIDKFLAKDIPQTAIRQFLMKNLTRNKDHSFSWKANLPVLEDSLDELGSALPPHSGIETDTLYIKGNLSKYISEKDLPLIKAHFPKAEFAGIEQAGHWVHAEQPEKFFQTSLIFLKN